jgi:predicted metal-dependent peptidase
MYTLLDTAGSEHVALFTNDIPTAATDGSALLINPDWFFKLKITEQVFVGAHEIMHCVLNHCIAGHNYAQRGEVSYADGTKIKYDQGQMNVAMDLVINDALISGNVGTMPQKGCHDRSLATSADPFTTAYRKIYNGQDNGPKGGFDEHLAPGSASGKNPEQAKKDHNQAEWDAQIHAAVSASRAMGRLPAELDRIFTELLKPQVEWRDHIQALFARKLGSGSYDWRRPDRRLIVQDIYSPGRSGFGAEFVVVAVDTSGSIGPAELNMFMSEVSGILEDIRPKRLACVMCDAVVRVVHELDDASSLRDIKLVGGGGTDFRPVFDWITEQGASPDALVYLTDGMGCFPFQQPNYPVIWGNIYPAAKYPFGDVVDVPKQAA